MLRRLLDYQLSLTEKGKPLHFIRPLIQAGDTFLFEPDERTKVRPYIRDAMDIKRWMILVVFALIPALLWGIWNTGLQSTVYSSGDYRLMDEYLTSTTSFEGYIAFSAKDDRFLTFWKEGLLIVIPVLFVSYAVGGLVEGLFACVRGHEISEGFLVSGILYALILPPTIPLWMVAVGVAVGIVFAKELFGGSGMNILNPAMSCRAFLFFGFPGRMSGNVWVGSNQTVVRESLVKMNQDSGRSLLDGYTQTTALGKFNVPQDIKRIHIDAIASNDLGSDVSTFGAIKEKFQAFSESHNVQGTLGALSPESLREFVTTPLSDGGLGLSSGYYEDAYQFASLNYGLGHSTDLGYFFGDKLGCLGESSTFFILLGALFLIYTGIGSWRVMVSMVLGALVTASLFQWGSTFLGEAGGAFLPAQFGFPAYKHLILGGFAFGCVYMATDPVSSPDRYGAKWIYGFFIGVVTLVIRVINPAFPEGVMLAVLMGNVFAPLFDHYATISFAKRRLSHVRAT